MVIPISEASVGYAQKVRATLRAARLHVEVDASDKKMQKKVREAQLAQFNYILVRGSLPCISLILPLRGLSQDMSCASDLRCHHLGLRF